MQKYRVPWSGGKGKSGISRGLSTEISEASSQDSGRICREGVARSRKARLTTAEVDAF